MKKNPPFRAEQVGGLIKPDYLIQAQKKHLAGQVDSVQLRTIENRAISENVRRLEALGMKSISDGELRRNHLHLDFLNHLEGIQVERTTRESEGFRFIVSGEIKHSQDILVADYQHLQSVTNQTPKLLLPSPSVVLHQPISWADPNFTPDLDQLFNQLEKSYRTEIDHLYQAGCRYLQLNDHHLSALYQIHVESLGARVTGGMKQILELFIRLINAVTTQHPDDLVIAFHCCQSQTGFSINPLSYETFCETLFNSLEVDSYFLEYDDERCGDFAPLRFIPSDKNVVLGIASSRLNDVELIDFLKSRIDEASQYLPTKQMGISTQCGFYNHPGNEAISIDLQWEKIALLVKTVREIWGDS